MRGLGRLIGKAAAGAAPVAMEKWRQDVLSKRDAKLREYEVQDRDVQMANSNEQARLTREQQDRQNSQQTALQAGELAVSQENLNLNRQRTAAAIKEIDSRIANAAVESAERKSLQEERNRVAEVIGSAVSDTEKRAAWDAFAVKIDKYSPPEMKMPTWETVTSEDALGGKTTVGGFADPSTMTFTQVTGLPSASGSPAAGDGMPKVGEVYDGMKFLGGDPNNEKSWGSVSSNESAPVATPNRGGLLSQAVPVPTTNNAEARTAPGDGVRFPRTSSTYGADSIQSPTQAAPKAEQAPSKKVSYYPSTNAGKSTIGKPRGLHSIEAMDKAMIELRDAYAKEINNVGTDTYKAKSLLKEINDLGKAITDAKG